MKLPALISVAAVLIAANIIAGTAWHEIVGHGLVGAACGGRINQIIVTGVQLWPQIAWTGPGGAFGWCDVEGVTGPVCAQLWLLTGSLSTLAVAALAIALLHVRNWPRGLRIVLLGCAFWWIDLFTYTLPSFGLRRYILFGRRISEPYDAAVALGIPGTGFQCLVVLTCMVLAFFSTRMLYKAISVRHSP